MVWTSLTEPMAASFTTTPEDTMICGTVACLIIPSMHFMKLNVGEMYIASLSVGPCDLFIYLGFYVVFNTVQVISQWVVRRAEETSTYSLLGFCTVNCRPTASNYQLSHLRPCREPNPSLRGGRRECYHSATVAPWSLWCNWLYINCNIQFAHGEGFVICK